jgi:hypothetical protein
MTIDYPVNLQIELEPVDQPWVAISAGGRTVRQQLTAISTFNFEFVANTNSCITITHFDKLSTDPSTAVIIKRLSFFGISDPRFVWSGQYRPQYPEPWFSAQFPRPPEVLTAHPYLGWNGEWRLEFEVPVFTWIHQVQKLGWIYN